LAVATQIISGVSVGAQPTAAPTSGIVPWLVGETTYSVSGDNAFDGGLNVSVAIGSDVDNTTSGAVKVELLDPTCTTLFNSTGEVVEIFDQGYSGSPFEYDVEFVLTKVADDTTFVSFDFDTVNGVSTEKSKGTISFCTRVTTIEGPIEVAFSESIFALSFDLTQNDFDITVGIAENTIQSFVTDVDSTFIVVVCQCVNFVCVTGTPAPIEMAQPLVLCIAPEEEGTDDSALNTGGNTAPKSASKTSSPVEIANFNLELSTPTITYDPVSFGSNGPEMDPLTQVENDDSSDTVQVAAPITAQFFIQGFDSLTAGGNAFLEFKGAAKTQRLPEFAPYSMEVALAPEAQAGCLQKLMDRLKGMFKEFPIPLELPELPTVQGVIPDIKLPVPDALDGLLSP